MRKALAKILRKFVRTLEPEKNKKQASVVPKDKATGITILNINGKRRYIGINAEADRLGVSRQHLWNVLNGTSTSARIKKQVKIKEVK